MMYLSLFSGIEAASVARYAALGNSIVTTCLRWIGERFGMAGSVRAREVA